jgi:hypothetical protein
LTTIGDGAEARGFDCATRPWEAGQSFEVKMAPRGGFVAILKRLE